MAAPTSIFDPRVRGATFAILLTVALSAFEGLAVAAALPQLANDLGGVSLLPWVITSYLLTSGVATIAAGALVDRLGVAPVFRVSVVVFVIGGVLAGIAPSMPLLIAARVLQGVGAGAINAVGLTAVGLVYPRSLVGRAFAANSTVWGVMSVAGPAITAGLLAVASWRWVFLVNLPLGGLALAVGWRALPARREDAAAGAAKLSTLNLALLTAFMLFALLAVDALDWRSVPAAAVAVAAAWWVLRRNRGRADALIAPRHAIHLPFGPLGLAVALLLVGAIGTQSFVPLYVSGARGAGTALTAWSVLFFVVGWTTGANVASRLMDRMPAFTVTQVGAAVVAPSLGAIAVATGLGAPLPVLFVFLFVAGAGMGSVTNSALTLLQGLITDDELGRATAAHQFVRNLGFAVGNALIGAVLLLVVGRTTGDVEQVRDALGEGGADAVADPAVAAAIGSGFTTAAVVAAIVAAGAVVPLRAVRRHLVRTAGDVALPNDAGTVEASDALAR